MWRNADSISQAWYSWTIFICISFISFRYRGQTWWRIWTITGHRSASKEIGVKLRSLVLIDIQVLVLLLSLFTSLTYSLQVIVHLQSNFLEPGFSKVFKCPQSVSHFLFPRLLTSMKSSGAALPLRPSLSAFFHFRRRCQDSPGSSGVTLLNRTFCDRNVLYLCHSVWQPLATCRYLNI